MAEMNFRWEETPPGMTPQPSSGLGCSSRKINAFPQGEGASPPRSATRPTDCRQSRGFANRPRGRGAFIAGRKPTRSLFFESYRSGFRSVKIEHVYAILSDAKRRIAPSGVGYPLPNAGEYQELAIQPPVDAVGLQHSLDVGARLGKRDALDVEIGIGPALPGEPPCGGGTGIVSGKGEDDIPAGALEHPAEISGPGA